LKRIVAMFPFVLSFVLIFLMQVVLETKDRLTPFVEPYGRETEAGMMSVNRPAHVVGEGKFLWLEKDELVLAEIDPATQQVKEARRPVPEQDIYAKTMFQLVGDDLFWIGNKGQLKRVTWEGGKWSQHKDVVEGAATFYAGEAHGKKVLFAAVGDELKVYEVQSPGLREVHTAPLKRGIYLHGQVDANGLLQVGAISQLAGEMVDLYYLTFDTRTMQASEMQWVQNLSFGNGSMVYESTFGLDKSHGYFLLTEKSNRKDNRELRVVAFPLSDPKQSRLLKMKVDGLEANMEDAFTAYVAPGQHDELKFAFSAGHRKNPRYGGYEVFLSTLKGGEWTKELKRVTNEHDVAINPVFSHQGETMTVVYTVKTNYDEYIVKYTSNDPSYAAAKNKLTSDDYKYSALEVPKYLGIAVITMFIATAWPILSYLYLLYYVIKKEDLIYDRPDRLMLIAVLLYVVVQVFTFLSYGKLDNYRIYAPEWMQSPVVIAGLLLVLDVLAYLFSRLFGKVRYERNAMAEFTYFAGLNIWMVLLGFSYFMAY
jgi:hypothetical protein